MNNEAKVVNKYKRSCDKKIVQNGNIFSFEQGTLLNIERETREQKKGYD